MRPSLSSRADLIRALAYDDPQLSTATAELLGYVYTPADRPEQARSLGASGLQESGESSEQARTKYEPIDVPFWRLESVVAVAQIEQPPQLSTRQEADPVWRNPPQTLPIFTPLAPKQVVLTRLRQVSAIRRTTNEVDVDAVVERLSRGGLLEQLPRRQQRAWGTEISIIEDRARRLTPYWHDQDYITAALQNLYPPNGVSIARMRDNDAQPMIRWPKGRRGQPIAPLPGSLVVVLGDLGCLASNDENLHRFWLQWGRQLRKQNNSAIALVPARLPEVPPELARTWTIVGWDATAATRGGVPLQPETRTIQRILTLLSPTARLEPGLLRAVRCVLPEGRGDPGLEARVWQDEAIASQHSVAATLDPDQRREYRKRFVEQSDPLSHSVMNVTRTWRGELHPAVWFEEILGLDAPLVDAADLEDAKEFFIAFAKAQKRQGKPSDDTAAWILRFTGRLPKEALRDPRVEKAVHDLYELVRPQTAESEVPGWYNPASAPLGDASVRQAELWQVADQLLVRAITDETQRPERGSPLGLIHTANGAVTVAVVKPERKKEDFWPNAQPPTWAHSYGWDEFGPWATFRIGDVGQRLRWIPAGSFVMGSPEDEEGRYDDEGPQHEVELTQGFWLFDTPCTQALWQAVMGTNPSKFEGDQRPVEQVSWDDCQELIAKLNELLPGLALCLPTEAQWEYGCRAGTKTARYAEDLDAIAWYGDSDSETHPVKQKRANAWGLYDTLGNVDEWCHDGQRRYTTESMLDPIGPLETGADRVIRGGVWDDDARGVRAAYRDWLHPGNRFVIIGFRCASSSQSQPVLLRPMWSESELQAEPAQTATQRPKPRRLDLNLQSNIWTEMPEEGGLRVNTDRDRLYFHQLTKPRWADEIGRDKYGLWVTFKVDEVRQRMRWIPPGRFWMGSPEDDKEAFEQERPQHEVLLTRGFWLFDTPCTQALWQVVMEQNPSRFKGEQLPVESVRWEDCQEFMQTLNTKVKDLALSLPTEAEWEHACRAGTETPRYAEDLDNIAWYDKNSDNETHPVKQKRPNAWGLYDMLGNVYEWCHDGQRDYKQDAEGDPIGPLEPGAFRVFRGGYWGGDARVVRAAFRRWDHPDVRVGSVGFRCASSGQASRLESRGETDSGGSGVRSETVPTDAGR